MRLITNAKKNTESHLFELRELLSSADEIVLCSGWMKDCGLSPLLLEMKRAINRGATIRVYTNKEHTESACIARLSAMAGLEHFNVPRPIYLHTKLYYGRKGDSYRAILGSANITSGGLWKNEEASYLIHGEVGDEGHEQLLPYLKRLSSLGNRSAGEGVPQG